MKRWSGAATAGLVVACVLAALLYPYRHGNPGKVLDVALGTSDFGAFYCGALVLREGGDPYRLAPLRACEVERVYAPTGLSYEQHGGIDPAPQAPYTLVLYEPLSLLPYRVAGLIWMALLLAAGFATAVLLERLTALPLWIPLAFLAPGTLTCVHLGQTQPLLTLALVSAALLLRTGRDVEAAAVLAATLINPQVGIAPLLALLLWTQRARLAVAIVGASAAALSLAAGGWGLNVEYAERVLPAQAFAEITVPYQYGLTALLAALGVPDALALHLGAFQYALVLIAGVLCARSLRQRIGAPALVLFPPACAVIGGTYIHPTQFMSAIPFALYLAAELPARASLAWIGAALVALNWPATVAGSLVLPAEAAIVFATAAGVARRTTPAVRAVVAAGAFLLYLAVGPLLRHLPPKVLHPLEPPSAVAAAGYDPALAATQLGVEARSDPAANGATLERLAVRIPSWTGLVAIFIAGLAAARRPPPAPQEA